VVPTSAHARPSDVGIRVRVGIGIRVGIRVGVSIGIRVGVSIGIRVGVGISIRVGVGVCIGDSSSIFLTATANSQRNHQQRHQCQTHGISR
jgi:hypothetical protein